MTGGGHNHAGHSKIVQLFDHQNAIQAPSEIEGNITSQQQIEKLKCKIRDVKESIAKAQDTKNQADKTLTSVEESINTNRVLKGRLVAECDAACRDIAFYRESLKDVSLPQLSSKEQRRVAELTQKVRECEDQVDKQKRVLEVYEKEAMTLLKEIDLIGCGRRKKAYDVFLSAKNELSKCMAHAEEEKVKQEVMKKRLTILDDLIPGKLKAIQDELKVQEDLVKERNVLTDKAEVVLQKKEELEKILQEQRKIESQEREALQVLLDEAHRAALEEAKYQTGLHDLNENLNFLDRTLRKYEKQISGFQQEWANLPDFHLALCALLSQKNKSETTSELKDEHNLQHVLDLDEDSLDHLDEVELSCTLERLTESVCDAKLDTSLIETFTELASKLKERTAELESYCVQKDALIKKLDGLDMMRLRVFKDGFCKIANYVKEMYQMLTHEGDAELELVDPSAPFLHGISFSVRPPRKSWKCIQNLSGGEKTLSSLALVFALQKFRPTPIYFLDEIDAALDHNNVSTIALYIASQAHSAQVVAVSLRNHMFELANRLFGIYKVRGSTMFTYIDPDTFVEDSEKGTLTLLDRQLQCNNERSPITSTRG